MASWREASYRFARLGGFFRLREVHGSEDVQFRFP